MIDTFKSDCYSEILTHYMSKNSGQKLPMLRWCWGLRQVTLYWLQCEMNWGIDVSTNTTVPISYTSLNIAGILYLVCLLSTHTVTLQSLFNKNWFISRSSLNASSPEKTQGMFPYFRWLFGLIESFGNRSWALKIWEKRSRLIKS